MAKKITPEDLINTIHTNKKNQKFKVIKYLKKETDYIYEVLFETGNIVVASRRQIVNCTVKDTKTDTEMKKKKKYTDYKKMNKGIKQADKILVKSKKETRLLSLDQSSSATGWCVIINGELVDYGTIKIKSSNTIERIYYTGKALREIIEKYKINSASIEDIYLGMGLITYKVLAMLMGVVVSLFYEYSIQYTIVTAPEWKASFKMLGKGQTREMQKKMAMSKTNADTDDLADALLIGMYTWNELVIEDTDTWD